MRENTSRWSSELRSSVLRLISSCCRSSWPSSLAGCRLQLVVLPRVADGDGGQVGEEAGGLQLAVLEGPAAEPVHGHDADDLVAHGQRDEDARLLLVPLGARDVHRARVLGHVVDELGLVVADHPAADALVDGDGEVEDLLLVLLVARVDGDELPALGVDQPHVHGVVVDDLLERVGDVLQHLGLLERREHGAAGAEQLVAERQLLLELLRRLLGLLVLARVVDGDGGEVGEQRDRLQLAALRTCALPAGRARARRAPCRPASSGAMMLACGSHSVPGHERAARVVQHVVDQLRLVVAHDPAADADVDGAAPGAHLLLGRVLVGGEAAVELAGLFVDQPDLQRVVVDDLLEQRRDAREDLARLERGEERAAELEDRVAQRQLRLQLRRGVLERLVLARVLDRHRGVRREHLERLDQLERRQLAVGRVVQVEHAHQLVVLVVEGHEQVVVARPLVRRGAGPRSSSGR